MTIPGLGEENKLGLVVCLNRDQDARAGLLSIAIVLGPFVAIGVPAYYVYKRVNGARSSS